MAKIHQKKERLNQIRKEIRKNEIHSRSKKHDNIEHASVMVECGTPYNSRRPKVIQNIAISLRGDKNLIFKCIHIFKKRRNLKV